MSEDSLYQKYGGAPTISSIVHNFYSKINETEELSKYFSNIDMDRLMKHQVDFLSKALGGPDNYQGKQLTAIHKPLKIDDSSFNLVGELLQESLEEAGMDDEDIKAVMAYVISLKSTVVV